MTGGPAPGCARDPVWPFLVVHAEAGDVVVEPAATPGGLACLYEAYCSRCGAAYPGPFRVPPAARHRTGPPRPAPAGVVNAPNLFTRALLETCWSVAPGPGSTLHTPARPGRPA